jgi:hypothetical protein
MIKANELRKGLLFDIDGIGLLPVMDFSCDFTGRLHQITFLSAMIFHKGRVPSETVETVIVIPWQAKPIPLNEEWLERMEFEQFEVTNSDGDEDTGWRHRIDHALQWINGIIRYDYDDLPHIQAVHQLQNLYFALNGEELIIRDKTASQNI